MGTSDVHVVALDVKTGRVVWDQPLTEERGFGLSGGPLVAKGKVMIGTSGRVGGKNYIVALDSETGNVAWRFNTIAQPGEPGGDTWNDHTAEERNGGSVWIAGSYDSALNLAFFGVAQTYDTAFTREARKARGEDRRPVHGLYLGHQSGYRQARLVLPAPAQRSVGPRLGI